MNDRQMTEAVFPRPISGALIDRPPPSLVPARISLSGRYVVLEPLDASRHAQPLYAASHGSETALRVWDYLPEGPWPSEAAYTAQLRQQTARLDRVYYAIRSLDAVYAGGQASFLDIRAENASIEIGHIWFGLALQRTRAATEALYLMMRHVMDDLGYRRLQWRCNALNERSRMAARRLGFRFEGVSYNHLIVKGRNRDTAWYSILDHEWPDARRLLEAWLSPSNFGAGDRAQTSLTELQDARGFDGTAIDRP